ncbi:tripartite tricarboxylate transporter substrate binding protein [Verticiella sediminum]|uniref:Tripartite tricarboxylate transporter substrate binding protein n=1 Tax=Verticiella sediminum TaxID=1247510 RepID=A0A556AUL8_9BURK|nr:tripartite tricarboxylate transporter substrate binding protein [Verticiella sediminum]TSH96638.1 tripartite tricarboxylate transporter substrate binding protein [Verticiella sediminum]
MQRSRFLGFGASLACAFTFAAAPALAADYPARDVTLMIPFPPGGTTDIIGRIVGNQLSKAWGKNVIVENKGGAGGNIGAADVSRAKGDGYYLLMGTVGTHAINQYLYANLPYDPDKSFEPVALAATVPNILVLNPAFAEQNQIDSVQDLIEYLKANPGKANVGSAGNGTSIHLTAELFKSMTGTDFAHVPFRGSGPAVTALMAGDVDFMFDNLPSSMGGIQGGRLKPIAVSSATRSPSLPDIPTIAESGVDGFDAVSWFAIFAPAGTPDEVVANINKTVVEMAGNADVKAQLLKQGAETSDMSVEQFAQFVKDEQAKWSVVVKESGARID